MLRNQIGTTRGLAKLLCSVIVIVVNSQYLHADLSSELKVAGQRLILNGEGIRKKTFVSIYECGLYLEKSNANAGEILESDSLMAIRVKILSGFVSRSSLLNSLKDGLKKSTGGKTKEIAAETEKFISSLQSEVRKNDIYDFVYVPKKGIYIFKNGAVQGLVAGLPFKKAFFGIWLSDSPTDSGLKTAMLNAGKNR